MEPVAIKPNCDPPQSIQTQVLEAARALVAAATEEESQSQLAHLYSITRPHVLRYARARLFCNPLAGQLGDAEDYAQVVINDFASHPNWVNSAIRKENVLPYLFRMVDRRITDDANAHKKSSALMTDLTNSSSDESIYTEGQRQKAANIADRIIERLIQTLPAKQKLYYTLIRIQHCKPADVARQYGVKVQSVCSALEIAHRKMEPLIERFATRLISCAERKKRS